MNCTVTHNQIVRSEGKWVAETCPSFSEVLCTECLEKAHHEG